MKSRIKNTIQLLLFLAVAAAAVFYVLNKSPLESHNDFKGVENNRNISSPVSPQTYTPDDSTEGDSVSLTGKDGRYDAARVGRKE
jgi:hypothetical protein